MKITEILGNYGFAPKDDTGVFRWAVGSLVWGYIAEVKSLGNNLYEVKYSEWLYNCDMDPVVDIESTQVLHGAQTLTFLFERMPLKGRR